MPFGDLTRQFAEHAIGKSTKELLGESLGGEKPASVPADSVGAVMIAQLQAMQKPLKDDEELVVSCELGREAVRVMEIFIPSWNVAVLIGFDSSKAVTRVVAPFETLRLVCKVAKVAPPAKPSRIRVVTPKA
jgi:hypothetical protein